MAAFTLHRPMTSCKVTKKLLGQLENYCRTQIPRVLKDELSRMMEVLNVPSPSALTKLSLTIQDKTGAQEFNSAAELKQEFFSPSTSRVVLRLRVGMPEVLNLSLSFPRNGAPTLEVSGTSRNARPICLRIYDHIRQILTPCANRNWIVHRKSFQVLAAILVPGGLIFYGNLQKMDLELLYISQGWLLLLALLLNVTLQKFLPLVSFQTGRRFAIGKILYGLLLALILAATAGYAAALLFKLNAFAS